MLRNVVINVQSVGLLTLESLSGANLGFDNLNALVTPPPHSITALKSPKLAQIGP